MTGTTDKFQALRDALAWNPNDGPHHIYTSPRDSNNWKANDAWHKAAWPQHVSALLAEVARLQSALTEALAAPVAQQAEPETLGQTVRMALTDFQMAKVNNRGDEYAGMRYAIERDRARHMRELHAAGLFDATQPAPPQAEPQPLPATAEDYLRGRHGAYRGHPAWRALGEAFEAGRAAQPAPVAVPQNLVSDREYLALFDAARAGSDKPSGTLRGIRACIAAYEAAQPVPQPAPRTRPVPGGYATWENLAIAQQAEIDRLKMYVPEGGAQPAPVVPTDAQPVWRQIGAMLGDGQTPQDEWPDDASAALGHLAGIAFGHAPSDEIGHCVGLVNEALAAPPAPAVAPAPAAAPAEGARWLPIESAPKDVDVLLFWGKPRIGRFMPTPTMDDQNRGWWFGAYAGFSPQGAPTHYMPLPAAPAEAP